MNNHYGESGNYILPICHSKTSDQIVVRRWDAKHECKGYIVGIHGGMAHAGDWELPAGFYTEKGYELHALDLPGHGTHAQMNQKKRNVLDIESFEEYAIRVHDLVTHIASQETERPIYIFGHSMGGLIALIYALGVGKNQSRVKGFGISSPWLKNKTKPPAPQFVINILAHLFPTLPVAMKLDLTQLTHDEEILRRHEVDLQSGLRGEFASPRFGLVSQQAQMKLSKDFAHWQEYPLAVAIAGADELADAEFTQQLLASVPCPLIHYRNYANNLHENFNEINREAVYEYLLTSLQM